MSTGPIPTGATTTGRTVWWGGRLWALVAEPRSITLIMCAVYAMIIGQGIANVIAPSIDHVDNFARLLVNVLLFAGGTIGILSTPRGFWQFERAAIVAILVAYGIHIYWTVFDLDGDSIVEWQKAARMTMIVLFFIARVQRIVGARLDPTKP